MMLLPIDIEDSQNNRFRNNDECIALLDVYVGYYKKIGFNMPWVGYLATVNGQALVGCGGYKGQPRAGRVEIAYGTFKGFEKKGIATAICRELVLLSLRTDPLVTITARTLVENYASRKVLQRNQFICQGIIWDEEDGDVLEWVYKP